MIAMITMGELTKGMDVYTPNRTTVSTTRAVGSGLDALLRQGMRYDDGLTTVTE